MAEQDSTTKMPQNWEWLMTLMDRALWPINSFIEILSQDENNVHLVATLTPLVDNAKAGLEILDDVLAESFGNGEHIKVKMTLNACGVPMMDSFDSYRRRYFGKAYISKPQAAEGGAT